MGNKPPTKEQWARIKKRVSEVYDPYPRYPWIWNYTPAQTWSPTTAPIYTTCNNVVPISNAHYYLEGKQEATQ